MPRAVARSPAWTASKRAACRSAMTLPEPERSPSLPRTSAESSQAGAVRVDARDHTRPAAQLVEGHVEDAELLVGREGGDLGRVGVGGDGRHAVDAGQVAQVPPVRRLIDLEISGKGQQARGNN